MVDDNHYPISIWQSGYVPEVFFVNFNFASAPIYIPVNTKYLYNISTTSTQRLRRWSNIVEMLYKCFVFTVYQW